jgi:hypothetical protein
MLPFVDFVKERTYLKNVLPRTVEFYWDCHKSVLLTLALQKYSYKHCRNRIWNKRDGLLGLVTGDRTLWLWRSPNFSICG